MKIHPGLFLSFLFLIAFPSWGEEVYPRPEWKETRDLIASPAASPGGEISIYGGDQPQSLNYLLDNNVFSWNVWVLLYEPLVNSDSLTLEPVPQIAEKWAISDDKKTFTFWINPQARWSDGQPITAEDVKWTFDTIMDPKNLTGVQKSSLQGFESPTILGPLQIQFRAKEVHWRNFLEVGILRVLPRHAFEGKDFNRINFEFPVVSGPYRIEKIDPGIMITLQRRSDYWRNSAPSLQGMYNFERLKFRMYGDPNNALDAFLKGEIDFFAETTAEQWIKRAVGEKFDKNWIVKQKVYNHQPIGVRGFAMNMRRAPFDDARVRRAMALCLNREFMNKTLAYDQYALQRSYYEDLYSAETPCPNELIPFDKEQARRLLAEAGWKANPNTGVLEKEGKPFSFEFLSRSPIEAKYLNVYQADLKEVGVEMRIAQKDFAAWLKDVTRFNFEMTLVNWNAVVLPWKDPRAQWHSSEAKREAGNNLVGFMNEEVDRIVDGYKTLFDLKDRLEACRKIDRIAVKETPYALLWYVNHARLLYWNKFGTPPTVCDKYDDGKMAWVYWWLDEDSKADLTDAMSTGNALPVRKAEIRFDQEFRPAGGGQ